MREEAQNVSNDSNNYEKSMYQKWTQPAHIKSHITWAKKGYNARLMMVQSFVASVQL